ncbi:unnamed protein product [Trifolium pratense]|uniref:Uncharacterized protein n=1 Tax=Trifolium pratense TaxID=57577 RepID=A0ACB0MCR6_TRIPR|nr:unnamed protein product [Trifolium pratense]
MDPSENLFRNLLYDYLKKSGLANTAESLQNEAQITGQTPPEFNQYTDGFLYDLWTSFYNMYYKYISMQEITRCSKQNQARDIGAIMDTAPQIIREGYYLRHLTGFPSHEKDTFLSCDFSSDGKNVASGGFGKKPFICYPEPRNSVYSSDSHLSAILEVRFQPGSTIFATSSTDKTVKLWNATTPAKPVYEFSHKGIVRSLDFHPTQGILCSSDTDVVEVWNLVQRVRTDHIMAGVRIVRFQPGSGMLLAVANQNVINILDFQTFTVQNCLRGHVKYICSLCWDVTGQTIASVSEDGLRVWSLSMGGQCLYHYPSEGKIFQSVIFHPRYRNVLVVGGFQCMELLILECNGQIHCIHSSGISITGLAACTQNEIFASTSNDFLPVVNIWK